MPGCVLRVSGKDFLPELVLSKLRLRPYSVFCRGDKRFPENPRSEKTHESGGFKCDVSKVDGDLAGQVRDAIEFLRKHFDDLQRLSSEPSIQSKCLDFGYDCELNERDCMVQGESLPVELLKLCAELGIRIDLSLYPSASSNIFDSLPGAAQ
jgi:hypothetical protein